ncbi:unnamed protein product, partial [Rotaria magnacalcarata]
NVRGSNRPKRGPRKTVPIKAATPAVKNIIALPP